MKKNKELESILEPLRELHTLETPLRSFAGFPIEKAAAALFAARDIMDKERNDSQNPV